jgi:hypothetical protein
MYCPACGVQSTHGLKYCNRCGASLGKDSRDPGNPVGRLVGLLPVSAVSIVGLIGFFVTINNLAGRLDARAITAIAVFGGMTVLGVVGLLIWLLLKLLEVPKADAPRTTLNDAVREIDDVVMAQLSSAPSATPSVTEGTTRNIDQLKQPERNTR